MPDNRHAGEKSGHKFPSSSHDSPWEHLSVENSHLASSHHAKKETRLQSKIADIDNALSGTTSLDVNLNQQTSTRWEQTHRYENNSQGLGCANDNATDAPYSSALSSNTATTSHSSPGEMTESSSTIEASAPESPDTGTSDRDRNFSSRSVTASRPRPFSRKSKAGNPHTVTPSAAGPEGGFVCKFLEHGKVCGKTFKLPSDIRFHLIEDHIDFSPFQCERCMRIYTRKSLYTRHLKEVSQEGTSRRTRQCPHRPVEQDEAFRIRKITYEALWDIQLTQNEVDKAINIIKQHNGALPSRRRRTQNINAPEPRPSVLLATEIQLPQSTDHSFRQRDDRDFPSQQASPPFGSQAAGATYSSTLLRSSSAPDLVPQTRIANGYPAQNPVADSAEGRRRSPVPSFGPNQSFQSVSPYSSEQDSSSLPAAQPTFHRFIEVGNPLYNPPTRLSGYFEPQQDYIDTIPTVDPHVLHQGTTHRHNSWDGSSIDHESNDDGHGAWTPTARDQNYRHQMTFGNDSQEYRGNYRYSTTP